MRIGTVNRLFCLVGVVMIGYLSGCSSVAEGTKTSDLSKALAQVKLLAELTSSERAAVEAVATLRQGKVGERLIQQGKSSGKLFVVLDGDAEILVDGKPYLTVKGQMFLGEMEYLDGLPAKGDVVLRKESKIVEIDNAALTALMEKQPRLGYVLMREIAKIEAHRLRESSVGSSK